MEMYDFESFSYRPVALCVQIQVSAWHMAQDRVAGSERVQMLEQKL